MMTAKFRIPAEKTSLVDGYDVMMNLLHGLDSVIPMDSWHRLPRTESEKNSGWTPLSKRDTYLRHVARDLGEDAKRWPGTGEGFSTLVTTAHDLPSWESGNRAVIKFSPRQGLITFEWLSDDATVATEFVRSRAAFLEVCKTANVYFACSDRPLAPRPSGAPGLTYYGIDYRTFPHREYLGWMGFVSRHIVPVQIPEADELIPLPECGGTMIVSVAGAFDVHNPDHIERAQRVEMRLVDIDALPVTDPRFL